LSITTLIAEGRVAERLDALIPVYTRTHHLPVLVERTSANASLIGTAFDYALRIEMQARYRHAEVEGWVAEHSAALLARFPFLISSRPVKGVAERALRVVEQAKAFVRRHVALRRPLEEVAAHAVRLAKLDPVLRAHYFDPTFARADKVAVREVVSLLQNAPFDLLSHPAVLKLNPTFGQYSIQVGGADADILAGDRIIDVKVRSRACVERAMVRQLIGYAMLANSVHKFDGSIQRPREVCIYFARHGFLWSMPTQRIFGHPAYEKTERWLVGGALISRKARATRDSRLVNGRPARS